MVWPPQTAWGWESKKEEPSIFRLQQQIVKSRFIRKCTITEYFRLWRRLSPSTSMAQVDPARSPASCSSEDGSTHDFRRDQYWSLFKVNTLNPKVLLLDGAAFLGRPRKGAPQGASGSLLRADFMDLGGSKPVLGGLGQNSQFWPSASL